MKTVEELGQEIIALQHEIRYLTEELEAARNDADGWRDLYCELYENSY